MKKRLPFAGMGVIFLNLILSIITVLAVSTISYYGIHELAKTYLFNKVYWFKALWVSLVGLLTWIWLIILKRYWLKKYNLKYIMFTNFMISVAIFLVVGIVLNHIKISYMLTSAINCFNGFLILVNMISFLSDLNDQLLVRRVSNNKRLLLDLLMHIIITFLTWIMMIYY